MRLRFHSILPSALLLSAGLILPTAYASPITPNTTITSPSTMTYSTTNLVATTGMQTLNAPGGGVAPTFSGMYDESVYRQASGYLTFVIQVMNSGPDTLEFITTGAYPVTGYGTSAAANVFSLDVGYSAVPGDLAPTSIAETNTGTVRFSYGTSNPFSSGSTSDYLVISTNATAFTAGTVSAIDSTTSANPGFVPSVAVTPEPSSLLLLGTGLIGAATTALRRRKLSV